jgi:hypothetical protein
VDKALRRVYIGRVRGRLLASACLVAGLGALTVAAAATACSCAPQSPAESLREADGAVAARLVRVLPHGPLRADFRYEVRHVYKGADSIDAGRMLDVRSARRGAACALPRRTERVYGLFISHRDGRWFGGICGVISPRRLRAAATHRPPADGSNVSPDATGCASS